MTTFRARAGKPCYSGKNGLMKYVICQLCRAKVEFNDSIPERCPKCQGRLPDDSPIYSAEGAKPCAELICPNCLGRVIELAIGNNNTCPICGETINLDLAARLSDNAEAIVKKPQKSLLEGETVAVVIEKLQKLGIEDFQARRLVDRFVSELPFERFRLEQEEKRRLPLAHSCDACGLEADLAMYEAEWQLNPEEMKRYSAGYAGFDGAFANVKEYKRQAVYCLCKKCYTRSGKADFADGYPSRYGFQLKKIAKRREPGASKGWFSWLHR